MTNNLCAKCGAELLAGARFCRRCGQASTFDGASVTEAETRVFQETAERRAPETQYYDQRPTGAGYLAPDEMGGLAADAAQAEAARRKRSSVIIGSVIVLVAIIALTVLAAIKLTSNPVPAPTETKTTVPAPPSVPQPPQPPQPPSAETGQASALDYPGADLTMEMTRGAAGSMRQLRTSDSFEKVVAWYKEKLKPSNTVEDKKTPSAVLKGKEATAIITADEEEGTQILLKKGIDQ